MTTERKIVLCDIDHVVSNAFHRDSMIGTVPWDEYHAAAVNDAPVPDVVALINALAAGGLAVWGFTARPGKWYSATMKWLLDHGVAMEGVIMRPDEDYRPSAPLKLEMARNIYGSDDAIRERVLAIIDDREDVATAFRGLGITVIHIHIRRD